MASKGSVLIIDDHPERATDLAAVLTSSGFEVQVVTDVLNTSFSLGPDSEFDVLLCELDLQGVSWDQARRTLRDMDVQVPAIMLSDTADANRIMTALRLGAHDFFVRPIEDAGALVRSIERSARQRRLRRELQESRQRLEAANRELRGTVKLLEQDQQAGRQVQLRMLPASPLLVGDYSFSHKVIPSFYLSGDFTDYFTVGKHHIAFFIADVSGHGSSSAFTTVLLKNLFARKRSDLLRRDDDTIMSPVRMLQRANAELLGLGVGKFATMVVALLDMRDNSLRYSVAGHLPLPVLLDDDGARYLDGEGPAVGIAADAAYEEHALSLPQRFTLALFTDGILETLQARNLVEKEMRLLSLFGRGAQPAGELQARLGLGRIEAPPDDIAALFLSRRA